MVRHYEAGSKPVSRRTAARCADVRLRRRFYLRGDNYDPQRDEVATPVEFFARLHREFRFTRDVAASASNAKLKRFWSRQDDALTKPWRGVLFCNPPYSPKMLGEWVRKAYQAGRSGATVVMILPARTNAEWFRDCVLKASEIRFVCGWLFRQFNRAMVIVFRRHRGAVRVSTMSAR
jgi:phage N-6-adenine-methyltransferase